jgi:uncharacterized membrane protein YhaH (DUF805 family)
MTLAQKLFSFTGRLNRKPYWIVGLILFALLLAVAFVSVLVSAHMMQAAFESGGSLEAPTQLTTLLIVGTGLLLTYPSTAIMVKRFHDRDKSGKWVLLLLVPALGKMATDLLGLTGQEIPLSEYNLDGTESFFEAWQKWMAAEWRIRPIEFAVGAYVFLVSVWFIIELGFLRGTIGPNRYGPDSLTADHAA